MTIGQRIKELRNSLGYTLDDIAKKVGTSKQTIQRYESGIIANIPSDKIETLANILGTTPSYLMGWEEDKETNTIMDGFSALPITHKIPLIGQIVCEEPILSQENIEAYIDVPLDRQADFALQCKGNSMIDAGIQDGDVVFIHKQPEVENGQIAAVRIDGEANLKRFYKNGDTIILQPANAAYSPMSYSGKTLESVRIEGLAVGFTHWF